MRRTVDRRRGFSYTASLIRDDGSNQGSHIVHDF
jgi:hypothetical protein